MTFNDIKVVTPLPMDYSGGAIGFGTMGFVNAQFDNFTIHSGEWARAGRLESG